MTAAAGLISHDTYCIIPAIFFPFADGPSSLTATASDIYRGRNCGGGRGLGCSVLWYAGIRVVVVRCVCGVQTNINQIERCSPPSRFATKFMLVVHLAVCRYSSPIGVLRLVGRGGDGRRIVIAYVKRGRVEGDGGHPRLFQCPFPLSRRMCGVTTLFLFGLVVLLAKRCLPSLSFGETQ